VVEEGAVVAGDEDGAGMGGDRPRDEGGGLVVEMVRRLVEQPAGGAGDQQVREREPYALTAADLPERGVAGQVREPEAGEGLLGAALRVPDVGEGGLGEDVVVAGGGRGGAAGELLPRRDQLPLEAPGALERVGEDAGERGAGA